MAKENNVGEALKILNRELRSRNSKITIESEGMKYEFNALRVVFKSAGASALPSGKVIDNPYVEIWPAGEVTLSENE